MILLTGATGTVGRPLLRRLIAAGEPVRCLVRDPRRLGAERVRVQIALGDLADPLSFRHALRGVDTVVHLAASIRDQPRGSIEELNAIATWRLVQSAERAGARRFVLFSAMGATTLSPARFFRAKALAEEAAVRSSLHTTVLAPSIVYSPGDPWLRLLARLSLLPAVPIPGPGRTLYQPIWAEDVADCVMAVLARDGDASGTRYELAGPDTLAHRDLVELALRSIGRPRPIVAVPLPVARRLLAVAGELVGPAVFATPDEADLMAIPMTTRSGTAAVERLGVDPQRARSVLGAA